MTSPSLGIRASIADFDDGERSRRRAATDLIEFAADCERGGVDAFYLDPRVPSDHAIGPRHVHLDPYVVLGAIARTTSRLEIGCCPTPHDHRHPAILAKVLSSLDVIANGRATAIFSSFITGVSDVDLQDLKERIEIVRALMRIPAATFPGEHYAINGAWNEPRVSDAPTKIGLLLEGVSEFVDEEPDDSGNVLQPIDLAARFCETVFLSIRPDGEEHLSRLLDAFAIRSRRAGRVKDAVAKVALLENVLANDFGHVQATIDSCRAIGIDQFVFEGPTDGDPHVLLDLVQRLRPSPQFAP